jgi:hypothetical protein
VYLATVVEHEELETQAKAAGIYNLDSPVDENDWTEEGLTLRKLEEIKKFPEKLKAAQKSKNAVLKSMRGQGTTKVEIEEAKNKPASMFYELPAQEFQCWQRRENPVKPRNKKVSRTVDVSRPAVATNKAQSVSGPAQEELDNVENAEGYESSLFDEEPIVKDRKRKQGVGMATAQEDSDEAEVLRDTRVLISMKNR